MSNTEASTCGPCRARRGRTRRDNPFLDIHAQTTDSRYAAISFGSIYMVMIRFLQAVNWSVLRDITVNYLESYYLSIVFYLERMMPFLSQFDQMSLEQRAQLRSTSEVYSEWVSKSTSDPRGAGMPSRLYDESHVLQSFLSFRNEANLLSIAYQYFDSLHSYTCSHTALRLHLFFQVLDRSASPQGV